MMEPNTSLVDDSCDKEENRCQSSKGIEDIAVNTGNSDEINSVVDIKCHGIIQKLHPGEDPQTDMQEKRNEDVADAKASTIWQQSVGITNAKHLVQDRFSGPSTGNSKMNGEFVFDDIVIKKELHSEEETITDSFSKITSINDAVRIKQEYPNPSILSRLDETDAARVDLVSTCAVCKETHNTGTLVTHVCKVIPMARSSVACGQIVRDQDQLGKHIPDHTSTPVVLDVIKIECGVCGRELRNAIAMETHRKQHEGELGDCLLNHTDCNKVLEQTRALLKGACTHDRESDEVDVYNYKKEELKNAPTLYNKRQAKSEIKVTLKCTKCGKDFQYLKSYKKHMASHKSTFSGKDCGKQFILKRQLQNHMKSHFKKSDTLPPSRDDLDVTPPYSGCSRTTPSHDASVETTSTVEVISVESRESEPEMKPHHADATNHRFEKVEEQNTTHSDLATVDYINEWTCKKCNLECQSKEELSKHRKVHRGRQHYCVVCNFHCKMLPGLEEHFKSHANMVKFHCKVCGETFPAILTLFRHYKTHAEYRKHKCDTCGAAYPRKTTLQTHLRQHTGERPYPCTLCAKAFIDGSSLRSHMISHNQNRKYKCEQCEKTFAYKINLVRHIRIHTNEKPYKCHHCDKRFSQSVQLSRHMRLLTGELMYTCEECGAKFAYKETLYSHSRIHNEKEYNIRCDICKRTFASKPLLSRHMKTVHFGRRDHMCHECGYCFPRKECLTKHMKLHA